MKEKRRGQVILPVDSDLQEIFSSSRGGVEVLVDSSGGTEFLSELTPELRF